MMTGNKKERFLIDTNIIIELFKGNKIIADKLNSLPGFYLPAVVLGELYTGIYRVSNKAKHLKKLHAFLSLGKSVNIDDTTARYYGQLVAELHKKGSPIPTNDIWIASIALQHNFVLVTNDKHFAQIVKLQILAW